MPCIGYSLEDENFRPKKKANEKWGLTTYWRTEVGENLDNSFTVPKNDVNFGNLLNIVTLKQTKIS